MNSTVFQYAWMIPHVLVLVIGLVLAIVNWSRCPRASLLAMLGLALIMINIFASIVISLVLQKMEGPSDRIATLYGVTGFLRSIVDAVGTLILVVAVFVGRPSPVMATMVPPHGKQPF